MATTPVDINALIRGPTRQLFTAGQDIQPVLADNGEQFVVEGLPPLAGLVREGNSYQVILTTGLTALTSLPTTTSGLSLNNLESGLTANAYVIEEFGSYQGVIDATQIDSTLLFAMLNKKGSAQATGGTLLTSSNYGSLSGTTAYGGVGQCRSGATVVNDVWFPHAQDFNGASPTLAGNVFICNNVRVRGLYVVPPGGTFSIAAVKSAAAAAAQQFYYIRWHEVPLNLG